MGPNLINDHVGLKRNVGGTLGLCGGSPNRDCQFPKFSLITTIRKITSTNQSHTAKSRGKNAFYKLRGKDPVGVVIQAGWKGGEDPVDF